MEETKKLKRSDLYRMIRELPTQDAVLAEVEKLLLPGRNQRRLTPEDNQALKETLQEVVKTYVAKVNAEIEANIAEISKVKAKYDEQSANVNPASDSASAQS